MPLLKKSRLDSLFPSNCRLISNLSIILKVLEILVLIQIRPHVFSSSSFSDYLPATEQIIQPKRRCLKSWTVSARDGRLSVIIIIGLDQSAAVQHNIGPILLNLLCDEFRGMSTKLSWLTIYIEKREQYLLCRSQPCILCQVSRKVSSWTNPVCSVHVSS